jgi:formiminotetrahydrofolate cyclodeaminase
MNLKGLTVKEFLDKVAGGSATPGGGSASALAGALSAALCVMVARLTLGKEKHREVWKDMEALRESADALSSRLLGLVDQDSEAYNKVLAAFRLPKGPGTERREAIQSALKDATFVPMETLRSVSKLVDLVDIAINKGNPNCLTDAGVSAQLIRATAMGAAYNVRINLSGIEDQDFKSRFASETSGLLARILRSMVKLEGALENRLK